MGNFAGAYCKIFPPIGIARVGDSPDEFFIGPEAPGVVPVMASYKDRQGRIKRQGARFRIYAFLSDGQVEEISADHPDVAEITWTVTLANRKAEWFKFAGANKVADVIAGSGERPGRRNPTVPDADRQKLVIGPVTQALSGRDSRSDEMAGTFSVPGHTARKVVIGELRTDEAGRLIVLGGHGVSESLSPDNPMFSYANNDQWHDDVSDGPVHAEVRLKSGETLGVRGIAWVICAPPHFSPHTRNVVSAYDVMVEAAIKHDLAWDPRELGLRPDMTTSFTRDIYPILHRLNLYQWVNDRAYRGHARGKRGAFDDPETLAILADPAAAKTSTSLHKRVFARLRTPLIHKPFKDGEPFNVAIDPGSQDARNQATLYFMPALSGDEGDVQHGDPETWLSLTDLQYFHLKQWKDGDFVGDWMGQPPAAEPFNAIPVDRQPAALTESSLEACQGGAFFPGIEITSVVRHRGFYEEAFRVSPDHEAGDITKWMALPWQADFYECSSHWWPTVRPDSVVPAVEFERILSEFSSEAANAELSKLLIARSDWTRGVSELVPPRPGLPSAEEGQSPAGYQTACAQKLAGFGAAALNSFLPRPIDNELPDVFRRRIQEFIVRALQLPPDLAPPFRKNEGLDDYRSRVVAELRKRFDTELAVPDPNPKEPTSLYVSRINAAAANKPLWQGLFDLNWRRRNLHRGKNDFILVWSKMGFVTRKDVNGETILIESDRGPFDLLRFRDAFYYLMNIESYPEFLPKAKELGQEYFTLGRDIEVSLVEIPEYRPYRFFRYDPVTFRARMEEIYEAEKRNAENYNPVTGAGESLFRAPEHIIERIRQLAPFNQLDGSWLERVVRAGPISDIQSFLFEIWSDEIGNGDPAQNHANVYTDLMRSAGIYMPPLDSAAYAQHPDLWEASFSSPAYQSAAALFPETFYPELLGMTLYLEWEAVYLPAMVKLYDYYGYSSLFYRLHVAIDNPVNGHGARARDAVVRYLSDVRLKGGEAEMQEHWRRIWNGYLAFKFIGSEEWSYRFANPQTIDEQVAQMIADKRHYAQLNHGTRRFAGNLINDWFDEPSQFMAALAGSDLVVPGDAKHSAIFELMAQNGPMLKVFTQKDKELLADWINSLPSEPAGPPGPAAEMVVLLRRMRARATGTSGHDDYLLKGVFDDPAQNGQSVPVEKPVSWWFSIGQPVNLMRALADTNNGWVIPGRAGDSRLVRELLGTQRPMARRLSRTVPNLGGKPARQVIVEWINAGCPLPATEVPKGLLKARVALMAGRTPGQPRYESDEYAPEVMRATLASTPTTAEQSRAIHRRRYGPGGGACH